MQVVQAYTVRPERSKQFGSVYQQHLRYMKASGDTETERARAIRASMDREENRSMWGTMRYNFSPNGGRSNAVTRVERIEDGQVVEYTDQEELEQVV